MNVALPRFRSNAGREDRLVRACVALSLLLLGGFAVLAAGQVTPIVVAFGAGLGYFALTAALAWDPLYARLGIDTRPEVPHEVDALIDADPFARDEQGPWQPAPAPTRYVSVVDVTEVTDASAIDLREGAATTSSAGA
jgi:hypothetical protein